MTLHYDSCRNSFAFPVVTCSESQYACFNDCSDSQKKTLRAVKPLQTCSTLVTYMSVWRRDLWSPNSNFLRPGRLTSSFAAKWSKRDGFQHWEPNLRNLLKVMKVWSYDKLSMYELLNDTIQPLYHLSFRNKWCFL